MFPKGWFKEVTGLLQGVCVWLVRGGPNIKRSSITQLELTHVAKAYIENTLTMSAVTKTKLQERLTQKRPGKYSIVFFFHILLTFVSFTS